MSMPVKLSDELVQDAREEAKATDRSITSQIEHWARLGRSVENVLRHEDVLALKRDDAPAPPTRRAIVAELRRVASGSSRAELAQTLRAGRTVYQDAGDGRIERIDRDGTRTIGRFAGRQFVAEQTAASKRRG